MRPEGDQDTLPLGRDWTGWLFVLLAVAAIVGVLYASSPTNSGARHAHARPVGPTTT